MKMPPVREHASSLIFHAEPLDSTACLQKKWCMWKHAVLINNYSIFSTAFYMIIMVIKLALKLRLFHQFAFVVLEICLINR